MEEMIDFDEWLKQQESIPAGYCAVYDPESGIIKSIQPLRSAVHETFKVDISTELAESIFSGSVNPGLFFVDPETCKIEALENQSLVKINQTLIRIPLKKFSEPGDYNVCITYNRSNKQIIFELSKKYGGTYWDNSNPPAKKVVFWDPSSTIDFLFCNYNDPNVMHKGISFNISDMIGQPKIFDNVDLPKRFSVYHTNKILKNYIVDEI